MRNMSHKSFRNIQYKNECSKSQNKRNRSVLRLKVRCEACRTEFEPIITLVESYNHDKEFDGLNHRPRIICHVCGRNYYPVIWKSDRNLTIIEG